MNRLIIDMSRLILDKLESDRQELLSRQNKLRRRQDQEQIDKEVQEILKKTRENAKDPQPIMPFGWARLDNIPKKGVKESDGKLSYELDFEFVKEMAIRMEANKGKYPAYNWMKPMDLEKLTEALKRHSFEVFAGNFKDGEDPFGHVAAIACNAMMIWRQLKNQSK